MMRNYTLGYASTLLTSLIHLDWAQSSYQCAPPIGHKPQIISLPQGKTLNHPLPLTRPLTQSCTLFLISQGCNNPS